MAPRITPGSQRSVLSALLLAALMVVLDIPFHQDLFATGSQWSMDAHAATSLEIAIHRARFGVASSIRVGQGPGLAYLLSRDAELLTPRLLGLPDRIAGFEQYRSQLVPYRNNENSLMLYDLLVLRLFPDASLGDMIHCHTLAKLLCLAILTAFLLRAGLSPLLSFVALHAAVSLVQQVNATRACSVYPFLLPLTALLLGLLGLALSFHVYRHKGLEALVLFGIGTVAGFLFHMRTSYVPVGLALVMLYSVAAGLANRGRYRHALTGCLALLLPVLCFWAGAKAYTLALIQPLENGATPSTNLNYSYHAIAHPLVLGLASPPNDLAQREGIKWDDDTGLALARRIDPNIQYLDENYEKALFVYYFKLWMLHGAEMRNLYLAKLQRSIKGPRAEAAFQQSWMRFLVKPVCWLPPSGPLVLGLFGALTLAPFFLRKWVAPESAFVLAGMASAGFLLTLESALICSDFSLQYHSFLAFWRLFLGLTTLQALVWLSFARLGQGRWRRRFGKAKVC